MILCAPKLEGEVDQLTVYWTYRSVALQQMIGQFMNDPSCLVEGSKKGE